jgi:GWxTD domain-containing protein
MPRLVRLVVLVVGLLSMTAVVAWGTKASTEAASVRALELQRSARRALLEGTADGRHRAKSLLEQALVLEPDNPTHWHLLGDVYASGRFGTQSRACYARALGIAPHDAGGWFLSGMAWRREWRRLLDPSALNRAIAAFDTCVRLDPGNGEAWLRLSGMLYEHAELDAAFDAAESAGEHGPYPDYNTLARAYLAYRTGDVARAETLFDRVIPRLDVSVRRWFEEPWLALEGAAGPRSGKDFLARSQAPFWESRDPDPTTPENEFRLEYWSRVAHAFLLFDDPVEPRFDARAVTYLQYGPPAQVTVVDGTIQGMMMSRDEHNRSLAEYPFISQIWDYPQYGMSIRLDDRALVGQYVRPLRRADDPASSPADAALRAQPDVVAINGGAALFTLRPQRARRLEVTVLHSLFEGNGSTRLSSQVRVHATLADSAVARWLVYDSNGREVARESRALDLSACAPDSLRVARFSVEVPGGDYRVFVSASDRLHRRALREAMVAVSTTGRGVGVSDVVAVCSEPGIQLQGNAVFLEAAEEPLARGEQALSCYFEIARLSASPQGQFQFQYRYRVQRLAETPAADAAPVEGPVLSEYTSEVIDVGGSLRRQFVTIPARTLAPGGYRLTIRVHDLASNLEAERSLDFRKE